MCLGVPMRLKSVEGKVGKAEMNGVARKVMLDLVPQVRAGDYVIVHAGYAIQALDEKEALETLSLFSEVFGSDLDA